MSDLKCVLWDLDGTIVDSEAFHFKRTIFEIASRKLGLVFDLEYDEFKGKEARSIFETLLAQNAKDSTQVCDGLYAQWYEYAVAAIMTNAHLVRLKPGVAAAVRALNQLSVVQGVVTSSRDDVANRYLDIHGLSSLLSVLVTRNDVAEPKPHPEPYELAVTRLNVAKQDCIAIEDSNSGIASAKSAGVPVIGWLEDGYELAEPHPDFLIRSLSFQPVFDLIKSLYFSR